MPQTKIANPQESANDQSKPYHQQPGEPDKWYDRFHRFCLLGPSRTLRQCYRQVLAERDTLAASAPGSSHKQRDRRVSGAWMKKVSEFDWYERAAAWDADQRQLALKRADEIINRIMKAALDALQIHIDMMYGQYKGPNGQIVIMQNEREIRMAAKTVLSKGLDLLPLLQLNQVHERPEIMINEVRVPAPEIDDSMKGLS